MSTENIQFKDRELRFVQPKMADMPPVTRTALLMSDGSLVSGPPFEASVNGVGRSEKWIARGGVIEEVVLLSASHVEVARCRLVTSLVVFDRWRDLQVIAWVDKEKGEWVAEVKLGKVPIINPLELKTIIPSSQATMRPSGTYLIVAGCGWKRGPDLQGPHPSGVATETWEFDIPVRITAVMLVSASGTVMASFVTDWSVARGEQLMILFSTDIAGVWSVNRS